MRDHKWSAPGAGQVKDGKLALAAHGCRRVLQKPVAAEFPVEPMPDNASFTIPDRMTILYPHEGTADF